MSIDRDSALQALSAATQLELSAYRMEHIDECIHRALERENAGDVLALVRLVRKDAAARGRFRRSVAVSTTGLYRDPAQFELLEREVLPELLDRSGRLMVWSAGCADGSELYTIAMVLDRLDRLDNAFLLGSDLLEENLAAARRGTYGDVTVPARLRARARWEQRDLVRDGAPGRGFRLILCRNVAIYLAQAGKRALHATLAGSLAGGGVLMVGRSERLTDPATLGLERVAPHAYRKAA